MLHACMYVSYTPWGMWLVKHGVRGKRKEHDWQIGRHTERQDGVQQQPLVKQGRARTEELPSTWKTQQATTPLTDTPSSCCLSYANAGRTACQCNAEDNVCVCVHVKCMCVFQSDALSTLSITASVVQVIWQDLRTHTHDTVSFYCVYMKLIAKKKWNVAMQVRIYYTTEDNIFCPKR